MIRLLSALALLLACAAPAHAHTRSQSQSLWTIDGDTVDARIEADAVDVTRLYALGGDAPIATMFAEEVVGAFDISADSQQCTATAPTRQSTNALGRVVVAWQFTCPPGALTRGPFEVESRLFLQVAPSHLHFVAVRDSAGRSGEAVLTSSRPRVELTLTATRATESFWSALLRFLPIGAQHVWSGLDHIAFMLALVLLVRGNLRLTLYAATGFTLGHTVTLGLAATGVLHPDTIAIEALIGFTIAFVAIEADAIGAARMRAWSGPIAVLLALAGAAALSHWAPLTPLIWFGLATFVYAYPRGFPRGVTWLAAIFGLIHGCGFAGALNALDLPPPYLLASLLGFNLGVEMGQAVVIASALVLGLPVARCLPLAAQLEAAPLAGAALFALGGFWFVSRVLG